MERIGWRPHAPRGAKRKKKKKNDKSIRTLIDPFKKFFGKKKRSLIQEILNVFEIFFLENPS